MTTESDMRLELTTLRRRLELIAKYARDQIVGGDDGPASDTTVSLIAGIADGKNDCIDYVRGLTEMGNMNGTLPDCVTKADNDQLDGPDPFDPNEYKTYEIDATEARARVASMVRDHMDEAEGKAWDALSKYKFQLFGYWAAFWAHLNHISGERHLSPFISLAKFGQERRQ